jgi:hypothetical protein
VERNDGVRLANTYEATLLAELLGLVHRGELLGMSEDITDKRTPSLPCGQLPTIDVVGVHPRGGFDPSDRIVGG